MEQAIKDYDQKPTPNNGKGKSAFVQYAIDQKDYHGGRYVPADNTIPEHVDFTYNADGYMPGHAGQTDYATMWTKYGVNEGLARLLSKRKHCFSLRYSHPQANPHRNHAISGTACARRSLAA